SNSISNGEGAIHVFDVRDPRAPLEVAEIRSPSPGRPYEAKVVGGRLFAFFRNEDSPQRDATLLVVDVSVPSAPVLLGMITGQHWWDLWPTQDGRFVLVTERGTDPLFRSVAIYDVSNPGDIRVAGSYRSLIGTRPSGIAGLGDRALIAFSGGLGFGSGVEILDISSPARPRLVGFYDFGGGVAPALRLTPGGGILTVVHDQLQILGSQ
ncbi:MAG TPA: hypothetical protein VM778_15240, partial [Gemmatimonadota bacterium]|nr:hypothetical protein [Gemmatimonadota bacterium]